MSFPPPTRPWSPPPEPAHVPMRGDEPAFDDDPEPAEPPAGAWRLNAILFAVTVPSVFLAGMFWAATDATAELPFVARFLGGWVFAVPLLTILVGHELGHYVAARLHGVPASLPYFLPLPVLSPFGTMGAVITMRGRIRSRIALLDIGAAGPIAGMVIAVPVLVVGLSLSTVRPISEGAYIQEGQSLLYWALKRAVLGPIPPGHDVYLHPTALAGWAGLLVTMINMLPWGQLDGGHIAYALLGPVQNRVSRFVRWTLLPLFLYNVAVFVGPVLLGTSELPLGLALSNSWFWLVWFVVLGVLGRLGGGRGGEHPPTEPGALSRGRAAVAVGTLVMFATLFMPTPWAAY